MYFVLYSYCNYIGCITDVTVMSDDGYVFIVKKETERQKDYKEKRFVAQIVLHPNFYILYA